MRLLPTILAAAVALIILSPTARAVVIYSADDAMTFPQGTAACKVKFGEIVESEKDSINGTKCEVTCEVISTLKGQFGKTVQLTYRQGGNGLQPIGPHIAHARAGAVYLVMLDGKDPPYRMTAFMKAVPEVVPLNFGTRPGDRLLAEMTAACGSSDAPTRIDAVEQIGIMRDIRGIGPVNAAAADAQPEIARAGLIAQYRLKIAPDAQRVMKLFNDQMLDVWYDESGIPQVGHDGAVVWDKPRHILERGLPDFDYATYIREGIKLAWVRKDDDTLYKFFGVPWKVQRKQCVPELIKLLDDPQKKVRFWAVACLTHTVEDRDAPTWEDYQEAEPANLQKWRTWWQSDGSTFMAEPATRPSR